MFSPPPDATLLFCYTSHSSHLSPAFLLVKARSRSDRRASSSSCACYESASSPGWPISPVCQSPFFPYLTFQFVFLVRSRQGGDAARAARQPRRAAQGDRAQIVLEIARVGDLSSASASIVPVSSLSVIVRSVCPYLINYISYMAFYLFTATLKLPYLINSNYNWDLSYLAFHRRNAVS